MVKNSNKSSDIDELLEIMAKLRDPDKGCPWDLEQNFSTLINHTIEETYEVADAIDSKDMMGLKDELGDLLFQIVFYAQLANESGNFNFSDVVDAISKKMIRRHPHVFSDTVYQTSEERLNAWEDIKCIEKKSKEKNFKETRNDSALDGVIISLPALSRANKLQKCASRAGFDWNTLSPVIAKVREELEEVKAEIQSGNKKRQQDELGDLLFSCVNLSRKLEIDPEIALRGSNVKFEKRFRLMEKQMKADGINFNEIPVDDVLDIYWKQAKIDNNTSSDKKN